MARGWESKAVEAQQEEKERSQSTRRVWSAEEAQRQDRRRTLELTRARILNDLHHANADAHRRMLGQALVAVDDQLAAIDRKD
jgi:CRISPR/Cas system Type II protein with McrA/HNH and RuvC-like nuclease domain